MTDLSVTFLVRKTGERVTKRFECYMECKKFVNKLRHSKKLLLVSYPVFE